MKKVGVKDRMMLPVIASSADQKAEFVSPKVVEKSSTGPGTMIAFMQRDSATFIENEQLRSELANYKSGHVTRKLPADSVLRSKWANRHEQSFSDKEFLRLKAEIDGAGGNIQPIKVRPLTGQDGKYEVVFGHRRHQACLELGLPVLAMIEDLSEQDLFAQMDRENRERKDLRPYEQGLMYAKALDSGLFASATKMATTIGVDAGNLGRALAIARLPSEVLEAFQSPLDIQLKWGAEIKSALEANPNLVLERAAALQARSPRPEGKEVLNTLLAKTGVQDGEGVSVQLEFAGKKSGHVLVTADASKMTATLKFKGLSVVQLEKVKRFAKELLNTA